MKSYQVLAKKAKKLRESNAKATDVLKPYGLSTSEWIVLGFITNEVSYVSTIADELDTSMSFVTNTINSLQRKGFVIKKSNQIDKRIHELHTDSKKLNLIKEIEKNVEKAI